MISPSKHFKSIIYSVLFFACTYLQAQGQAKLPPSIEHPKYYEKYVAGKKPPVIKGRIINLPDSLRKLAHPVTIHTYTLDVEGSVVVPLAIAPGGNFEIRCDMAMPFKKIGIEVGDHLIKPIYLTGNLTVNIDHNKILHNKGFTYKGQDAELNVFMDKYDAFKTQYYARRHYLQMMAHLFDKDTTSKAFLRSWRDLTCAYEKELTAFFKRTPKYARYHWVAEQETDADKFRDLTEYYSKLQLALHDESLQKELSGFTPRYISKSVTLLYWYLRHYADKKLADINRYELNTAFIGALKAKYAGDLQKRADLENFLKQYNMFVELENPSALNKPLADSVNAGFSNIIKQDTTFVQSFANRWNAARDAASYYNLQARYFGKVRSEMMIAAGLPTHIQLPIDEFRAEYRKKTPFIHSTLIRKHLSAYLKKIDGVVGNTAEFKTTTKTSAGMAGHYSLNTVNLPGGHKLFNNDKLTGADIVSQLQQDHQGKTILIDMWATWCAPCIANFERSGELEAAMDSSKVVFVYLCNQSPEKEWAMRVAKHNLQGVNILLSPDQTAQLFKKFNFSGFPSYLLIDKNGNVDYTAERLFSGDKNAAIKKLTDLANE